MYAFQRPVKCFLLWKLWNYLLSESSIKTEQLLCTPENQSLLHHSMAILSKICGQFQYRYCSFLDLQVSLCKLHSLLTLMLPSSLLCRRLTAKCRVLQAIDNALRRDDFEKIQEDDIRKVRISLLRFSWFLTLYKNEICHFIHLSFIYHFINLSYQSFHYFLLIRDPFDRKPNSTNVWKLPDLFQHVM